MKPFQENEKFTRVHNYLMDKIMPIVKPNAWKVLCCILRSTSGWVMNNGTRKLTDQLSYSQLLKKTGIKNRNTLSAAITELVERNLVNLTPGEGWEANEYGINWDYEVASTEIVLPDVVASTKTVPIPSTEIVPEPSTEIVPTKERERNSLKKKGTAPTPRPVSEHQQIVNAYVTELAYTPPNMGREVKAAKWLVDNRYSPDLVIECYRHMKRDKFWSDKFLSLQKVAEQISEFSARHKPAAKLAETRTVGGVIQEKIGGVWYNKRNNTPTGAA